MAEVLRFADFQVGQSFSGGTLTVTAAEIKEFASHYDPQPFHIDDAAAEAGPFGGLAASGWHTSALTMRLLVETLPIAGGIVGAGIDELRWTRPVRPGDVLSVTSEVLETTPSSSRPGTGRVRMATRTHLADGTPVQTLIATLVVRG
jgi:acyl dehydratase